MGDFFQPITVVFDTGSDWTVVQGMGCVNCEGDVYNPGYSGRQLETNLSSRNYGSAALIGSAYKDKVCLNALKCVNNFVFFNVQN